MNVQAMLTIAYRDVLKFLHDRARIASTLIFPVIFITILGGSLQKNLGSAAGYNFLAFTFTGIFAQTLFQSSALGVISLIQDRETDFSQEIFVAPISRYVIVFGKIAGESAVSMFQGLALLPLAVIIGVPMDLGQALSLIPIGIIICIFGGAFGIVILANMSNQRAANQLFPFVFLPQFFLAGVFAPIKHLPWYLAVLSLVSPLRYAVDLTRGVFYADHADREKVVLASVSINLLVIGVMFGVFMLAGTWLFVRAERNR